jgi:hypothetical protein
VGFLLAIPPYSLRAHQEIGNHFNALDGSWQLDLPARLARGEWAGRDFVFTYGPLYQVTHAFGLLVPPHDLASLMRWHGLVEVILVMGCVWFLLHMTAAPLACRAPIYLLWAWLCPPFLASLNTFNVGIKPVAGLTLCAWCGYLLASRGEKRCPGRPAAAILLWSLSAPALMLYSFDLGVLTLAALVMAGVTLGLIGTAWSRGEPAGIGRRALGMAAAAILGLSLFALILSGTPWRHYLSRSWEVAAGYTVALATGCTGRYLLTLAAVLAAAVCAMAVAGVGVTRLRRAGLRIPGSVPALFVAGCFCVVWSRYGLTRAEWDHIWPTIAIAVLVCGGMLPCYLAARGHRFWWLLLGLWALLVVAKGPLGRPAAVLRSAPKRLAALADFQAEEARLEMHGTLAKATSVASTLPGSSLYVWPYELIVGLAAGKSNPTYTVQSYAAHDPELEQLDMESLNALPAVLLFTDSWPIDDVDHISRNSSIFRYLLDHYQRTSADDPEFLVLQPRQSSASPWRERVVSEKEIGYRPRDGSNLAVPLADGKVSYASDLFLLCVRMARTPAWPWGKPGELFATFALSNGENRTHRLLVPADGQSHDVLVSACVPGRGFLRPLFEPGHWVRSRESVIGLHLRWTPMDRLSLRPGEIVVERAAVLRRDVSLSRIEPLLQMEAASSPGHSPPDPR